MAQPNLWFLVVLARRCSEPYPSLIPLLKNQQGPSPNSSRETGCFSGQ